MTPKEKEIFTQIGHTVVALAARVAALESRVVRLQAQVNGAKGAKARARKAAARKVLAVVEAGPPPAVSAVPLGARGRRPRPMSRDHLLRWMPPDALAIVTECAAAAGLTPQQLVSGEMRAEFIGPRSAAIVRLLALPMSVSAVARLLDRDRKTILKARRQHEAAAADHPVDPVPVPESASQILLREAA